MNKESCTTLFTIKEVSLREDGRIVVIVDYGIQGETPERVELKIGESIEASLVGSNARTVRL